MSLNYATAIDSDKQLRNVFTSLKRDNTRQVKMIDFDTHKVVFLKEFSSYSAVVRSWNIDRQDFDIIQVVIQTMKYPHAKVFWTRNTKKVVTELLGAEEYYEHNVTFHDIRIMPARQSIIGRGGQLQF